MLPGPARSAAPGVHGIPREREWDAVASAEAPELPGEELDFVALADGTLVVDEDVPDGALSPLADALAGQIRPPYHGYAFWQQDDVWTVAAKRVAVVEVPEDVARRRGGARRERGDAHGRRRRRAVEGRDPEPRGLRRRAIRLVRPPREPPGRHALGGHGTPALSRYPRNDAGDDFGGFESVLRVGEGRRLKRLRSQAEYIATLEPEFEKLSDEELKGKTAEFRQRVANGEALEDILFEAYATVREAFKRAMGVRLFDVQMMGGIVLHEGDIAEMKTGEGKTFVATMPLYLNSLTGQNVHLVTVNDYLAKRDPEWVKPAYDALGIRAGFIQNLMPFAERTEAYSADITYGTNAEFGFDYLRDNMAVTLEGTVQRGHTFAIVDEVDSILIDEARTPLIISGEPETAAQVYYDFARVVKGMNGERSKQKSDGKGIDETERSGADYLYDEKFKTVSPAQSAIDKIERALGIENLYDARNMQFVNHLNQALKAQSLFQRDVDYVVQDGEVKIVDEFTGRIMEGRRWSEGLHQAVEAKEGVPIQEENVTLATITLQNYFRLYEKLAGMTGTAKTEEKEFVEIYNLHVVEIPTNVEVARDDKNDFIFKTKEAKYDAVLDGHQGAPREGPAGARRHDLRRGLGAPLAAPAARRASRTTS